MVNTSVLDPLLEAARIPRGMPTRIVATNAVPRSSIVFGSLQDISSITGRWVKNETPNWNVNMFLTYLRYRMDIDSLRPYKSMSCRLTSVPICGSSIMPTAGTGDTTWNITKLRVATTYKMIKDTAILLIKYSLIRFSP